MGNMRGAYLLPELVHAPLGQLLPHFDGISLYGLWCWLGILKGCSVTGFTHVVGLQGTQRSSLVQRRTVSELRGCFLRYQR